LRRLLLLACRRLVNGGNGIRVGCRSAATADRLRHGLFSRTTLVNGLDSSSDLASFFVSVGFVWAVIAIVDVVFGAESVAAVNPCWPALGTFTGSMD
jgi:hypothetical protein